jgi:hypothetical protein
VSGYGTQGSSARFKVKGIGCKVKKEIGEPETMKFGEKALTVSQVLQFAVYLKPYTLYLIPCL